MKDQSLIPNNTPLQSFTNGTLNVHIRAFRDEDDNVWFVAKDVALALGYQNPSKAIADHVAGEDKLNNVSLSSLGQRGGWLINESGLYSLIFASKLPSAKLFKRWVTNDVLPSIRKHGAYATPVTIKNIISNPDFGIRLLTQLKDEEEKREAAEKQIETDKPYTTFGKALSVAENDITVGQFAKILRQNGYKTGPNRLFKQWVAEKVVFKKPLEPGRSCYWPFQRCLEAGWFKMKGRTYVDAKGPHSYYTLTVTPKGQRHFLNKYLKSVPMMIEADDD